MTSGLLTQLSAGLHQITLLSVIDILLVAIIVYQFLVLLRGTRASQMLVGLLLLVVAYYGSQWGNLATVHWILSTALPYFVFAIIVLFQVEIRQALANLGRRWSAVGRGRAHSRGTYEDVVLAANFLSSKRIGGLIVLARNTGLRTYIESGIAVDAVLSYDLLVTIFRPGGPLHDGAVLVQRDRLAAAACFLPISMNPVLSTQLGTRHRAAIGISEETDAVAVVISETTGSISMAVAGKIDLDIDVEHLRLRLGELFDQYIPPLVLPTAGQAPLDSVPVEHTREVNRR
jgi:diadenylate cyclase